MEAIEDGERHLIEEGREPGRGVFQVFANLRSACKYTLKLPFWEAEEQSAAGTLTAGILMKS